jgi:hypothetical protein
MLLLHRYGSVCIVESTYAAVPGAQAQAALRSALLHLFQCMSGRTEDE